MTQSSVDVVNSEGSRRKNSEQAGKEEDGTESSLRIWTIKSDSAECKLGAFTVLGRRTKRNGMI